MNLLVKIDYKKEIIPVGARIVIASLKKGGGGVVKKDNKTILLHKETLHFLFYDGNCGLYYSTKLLQ